MQEKKTSKFLFIAAIFGAIAVTLGAFGAHGLKNIITPEKIAIYKTGINYHFYHTFALLLLGIIYQQGPTKLLNWSGNCFIIGIILFSGSLYLLATHTILGIESWWFLGPMTPIGGLFFILGWGLLAVGIKKNH